MRWTKIPLVVAIIATSIFSGGEEKPPDWYSKLSEVDRKRQLDIWNKFEDETKFQKLFRSSKGDRGQIANACPLPAAWEPAADVNNATVWALVPYYVASKTFPKNRGMVATVKSADGQALKLDQCDYIEIKFNDDDVQNIDFSKCDNIGITSGANTRCVGLLKKLAEKAKAK